MKKIVILMLLCNSLQGQISGYVEYNYSVIHVIDYETKSVLKFNADKSNFTTLKNVSLNDTVPKLISTEGGSLNYLESKDCTKPIFYTNKENNMLITKLRSFGEGYILKEPIPVIPWEIMSEYKSLSGLRCQKAIGYFRGRTYEVWFTEAIPISLGPWKLQGLPGLILEAKDENDRYFYRATKIKLNTNDSIETPDLSSAIALKTFITEIQPKIIEDRQNRLKSKLDRDTSVVSSSGIDRWSRKEVLYEWEEKEKAPKKD
jgi:GLPGLI family protein